MRHGKYVVISKQNYQEQVRKKCSKSDFEMKKQRAVKHSRPLDLSVVGRSGLKSVCQLSVFTLWLLALLRSLDAIRSWHVRRPSAREHVIFGCEGRWIPLESAVQTACFPFWPLTSSTPPPPPPRCGTTTERIECTSHRIVFHGRILFQVVS